MAPSRLYYLRKKLLWSELGGPLCQRTVFLWIDVGVVDVLMEGLDRGCQILTLSPVHQPPTSIHSPNLAIRKLPLHLVHPSPDDRADIHGHRHRYPVPAFILKLYFDLVDHSINQSTAPIFRVLLPPVRFVSAKPAVHSSEIIFQIFLPRDVGW